MTGADASAPGPGFAAPRRLRLISLEPEPLEAPEVEWLASALEARLRNHVSVEGFGRPAESWRDGGSQLDSGAIVDALMERYPGGGEEEWVLALTAADLRGGRRRFVFGEATRGGGWAVVGTARFGARGDPLFRRRLLREALHELGHLAGLRHCADAACLMSASRDVAEVDRKGDAICAACRAGVARGGT